LTTIVETNQIGGVVKTFSVPTQNITVANSSLMDGNATVNILAYTFPLLENAIMVVTVSLYPNQSPRTLNNQQVTIPKYGIVYAVPIQNSTFDQVQNQLTLTLSYQQNTFVSPVVSVNNNSTSDNLQWLNLQVNHTSLYATYLQSGVADDVATYVQFTYNNLTTNNANSDTNVMMYTVSITLPHFWEYSEFAIVYSVAHENVNSSNVVSGSGGKTKWYKSELFIILVSVLGGVAVIAVIAIVIVIVVKKETSSSALNPFYAPHSSNKVEMKKINKLK